MALTETRPEADSGEPVAVERPGPSELERLIGSGDHVSNGRLHVGFALFFLAVSALGLAIAGLDRVTEDGLLGGVSDRLWTSSLTALVLMGVLPLLIGLAIIVVPLQVGSPSIAFARAAAFSLWSWLIGAALFVVSVVIDGGIGGADDTAARLGNLSIGLMMAALIMSTTCVATTVLTHRPIGMILARTPLFSWSVLVAAPVWILALGSALAHIFVGQISQAGAGDLMANFQVNLAWFLHAPAIYMVAIPALGIAGDVVAHVTGRRLAPYGVYQGAIAAFAVLSFGAWSQQPAAGQTVVWTAFVIVAGLPVLAMLGGLGDSLRRGGFSARASLIGSLLALLVILGGVLVAAIQALDTFGSGNLFSLQTGLLGDAQTLFLVTAAALGGVAGVIHWSERIFGAASAEGMTKAAVGAILLGGGLAATVLLVEAIAAGDGRDGLPDGLVNGAVAAGAGLVALGVLAVLAAVVGAARDGADGAGDAGSSTDGGTLDWEHRGLAVAGVATTVATVQSPYPLIDLRDGGAPDKEGT